ncbi:MAG: histidine phosphatase family protein [Deltaproteobacteria bacterium]
MELILIRHGETLWNKEGRIQGTSDIELSDAGMQQARLLALSLKDQTICAIHASPLKRALKTAEIINEFHRKEIQIHSDLMEMDQGDFEGFSFKELMACEKEFLNKWIADPASVKMPHGESLNQLQGRAWRAVETILNKEENALVVAHNFTIAAILCRIRKISLSEFRSACVDTASKTIVRFQNGEAEIIALNDRSHLPEASKK